jgi:hypothetical protein
VNLNKNLDLEDQNVSPKEVEREELLGILT